MHAAAAAGSTRGNRNAAKENAGSGQEHRAEGTGERGQVRGSDGRRQGLPLSHAGLSLATHLGGDGRRQIMCQVGRQPVREDRTEHRDPDGRADGRKIVAPEVAAPRSRWCPAYCPATTNTCMAAPRPSPRTTMYRLIRSAPVRASSVLGNGMPTTINAVPAIGNGR